MTFKSTNCVEPVIHRTPEEAEAAFYRAFENADLSAMMNVWHDTDQVECIHPMGERLRGLDAVRQSWKHIFFNPPAITFEIECRNVVRQGTLAVHLVNERMTIDQDHSQISYVIATNVYQDTPSGWRMIMHHASPAPRKMNERRKPRNALLH